jgi:hypothetical protein
MTPTRLLDATYLMVEWDFLLLKLNCFCIHTFKSKFLSCSGKTVKCELVKHILVHLVKCLSFVIVPQFSHIFSTGIAFL